MLWQRIISFAALAALVVIPGSVHADSAKPLKIGVLNDQSGPYADITGQGSVVAAQIDTAPPVSDFSGTGGAGVRGGGIMSRASWESRKVFRLRNSSSSATGMTIPISG